MEIRDKVKAKIEEIHGDWHTGKYSRWEVIDQILSIEELAIVDRDAELPLQNNKCALWDLYQKGWLESQQNMRLAGYVLEVKE